MIWVSGGDGPEGSGTNWFDGHGPPVDVLGAKVGDYYLDVDSGLIYKLAEG